MPTRHKLPAVVPRGLVFLLSSLFLIACLPCNHAEAMPPPAPGPTVPFSNATPIPYFSPFGVAQQSDSSPQTVAVAAPSQLDLLAMPPEKLGDLMMIHRRYLAAIEAYQRAPQTSAVVWNKLGMAYQHMYALDIAKLQYEKALQLNPKYPEALNNLGTVYYGQRNYHKAEKFYKKALHLKPNTATFYSNLGTAYFADHDYKRGIKAYRAAFSLDPEVFIGNPLDRVSEMTPTDEEIALNYALARLYARAGMFQNAIHCLRSAFLYGFNDNDKLMKDQAFAALRKTPQFRLFMTEEHIKPSNDDREQSYFIQANSPQHR
ncbi:MAG: tetratricopeptide repeat protein [Acidobacteriaceae bacterium]